MLNRNQTDAFFCLDNIVSQENRVLKNSDSVIINGVGELSSLRRFLSSLEA